MPLLVTAGGSEAFLQVKRRWISWRSWLGSLSGYVFPHCLLDFDILILTFSYLLYFALILFAWLETLPPKLQGNVLWICSDQVQHLDVLPPRHWWGISVLLAKGAASLSSLLLRYWQKVGNTCNKGHKCSRVQFANSPYINSIESLKQIEFVQSVQQESTTSFSVRSLPTKVKEHVKNARRMWNLIVEHIIIASHHLASCCDAEDRFDKPPSAVDGSRLQRDLSGTSSFSGTSWNVFIFSIRFGTACAS